MKDTDGNPCTFHNYYKHQRCPKNGRKKVEWDDWWSCACNDKCPECDAEIEPYKSVEEDLSTPIVDSLNGHSKETAAVSKRLTPEEMMVHMYLALGQAMGIPKEFLLSTPVVKPGVYVDLWTSAMKQQPPLAPNEYRCAQCHEVFEKGWSEEEAQAEKTANGWGDIPMKECSVICDDCYQKDIAIISPQEINEQHKEELREYAAKTGRKSGRCKS